MFSNRLDVLQRLTSHLKGITPANGYDVDLSASVFRGRTVFGADDPVPLISILESPRSDSGLYAGSGNDARVENWSLMIQGWTTDDIENPTDPVYGLLADVEHRLSRLGEISQINGCPVYPDEYLLGRTIGGITLRPPVVRPPVENVSSKAFFYLPVQVVLVRSNE